MQREVATLSAQALAESGRLDKPIVVEIVEYDAFYAAEAYPQDYYRTNTAHYKAYRKGSVGWRRIVELFTTAVLDDEGEIDRQALGSMVFNDPQALALLNAAIHPLIRDRVKARLRELGDGGTEVAVVDAALLYQAGWDDMTEEVWQVIAPTSMAI